MVEPAPLRKQPLHKATGQVGAGPHSLTSLRLVRVLVPAGSCIEGAAQANNISLSRISEAKSDLGYTHATKSSQQFIHTYITHYLRPTASPSMAVLLWNLSDDVNGRLSNLTCQVSLASTRV